MMLCWIVFLINTHYLITMIWTVTSQIWFLDFKGCSFCLFVRANSTIKYYSHYFFNLLVNTCFCLCLNLYVGNEIKIFSYLLYFIIVVFFLTTIKNFSTPFYCYHSLNRITLRITTLIRFSCYSTPPTRLLLCTHLDKLKTILYYSLFHIFLYLFFKFHCDKHTTWFMSFYKISM